MCKDRGANKYAPKDISKAVAGLGFRVLQPETPNPEPETYSYL
jgi:hypothetical protein